MILIDKNETTGWSHMVASTIPELHSFAKRMGCTRFSNKRGKYQPHYDVRGEEYDKALELGAILVSSKAIIHFLRLHYGSDISQDRIDKLVMIWEVFHFALNEEVLETSSDYHKEKLEKMMESAEKKCDEYSKFGSEVADYLAMFELLSKVF
jgi:hypothetical protein|tara:strand:- start:456 stop:911 length:456 start_codon:yes stop_codon:yes gene_type:complete